MTQFDKPNVTIPLAASYNERGVDGYTATVTNSLDQRKINSIYELVSNPVSGKQTLYLTKRPGVASAGVSIGTTADTCYLIISTGSGAPSEQWVFARNSNDIKAMNSATSTTLLNSGTYHPNYVDRTLISGTETIVVQLRSAFVDLQRVYYASAIGSWTEITDSVFTGLGHRGKMEFMDGFGFVLSTTNKIYSTNLNTLATWPASSYITKAIQQDDPRGLAKFKNQIIAFGDSTMEVFRNAGNATGSPLQSVKELATNVGLGNIASPLSGNIFRHYYCVSGNVMYFVGKLPGLYSQGFYAYDGQHVQKISSPSIDKILNGASILSLTHMSQVVLDSQEGIAISLNSSLTATPQRWLMYFPKWNEWFEWQSTQITPICGGRFLLSLSGVSAVLNEASKSDVWTDNGAAYTMTHQFTLPQAGNHRKYMPMLGVIGDTARSASTLNVETSDDDGQTWATARGIDMTSSDKKLTRCGSYRGRMVRLSHTGNVECRLEKFVARINEG